MLSSRKFNSLSKPYPLVAILRNHSKSIQLHVSFKGVLLQRKRHIIYMSTVFSHEVKKTIKSHSDINKLKKLKDHQPDAVITSIF